jgi:hypothetical protein
LTVADLGGGILAAPITSKGFAHTPGGERAASRQRRLSSSQEPADLLSISRSRFHLRLQDKTAQLVGRAALTFVFQKACGASFCAATPHLLASQASPSGWQFQES